MEALIRSCVNILDRLSLLISNIFMMLIVPLIGVMLFEACARYFFDAPTVWGPQFSMMLFGIYIVFAGVTSVLDKVQVGVDFFTSRLSKRTRAGLDCVTYIFSLVFFTALLVKSFSYGLESIEMREISTSAWGQPVYHFKMLLAIGVFFTFLQTVSEFLHNLYLAVTGREA